MRNSLLKMGLGLVAVAVLFSGCGNNVKDNDDSKNKVTFDKKAYSAGYEEGSNAIPSANWENEGLAVVGKDGYTHVSTKGIMKMYCEAFVRATLEMVMINKETSQPSEDTMFQSCIEGYTDGLNRINSKN